MAATTPAVSSEKNEKIERLKSSIVMGPKSGPYTSSLKVVTLERTFGLDRHNLGKLIKQLFPDAELKRKKGDNSFYVGIRLKDENLQPSTCLSTPSNSNWTTTERLRKELEETKRLVLFQQQEIFRQNGAILRKDAEIERLKGAPDQEFSNLKTAMVRLSEGKDNGLITCSFDELRATVIEKAPQLNNMLQSLMQKGPTDCKKTELVSTMAIQSILHSASQKVSASQLMVGLHMMGCSTSSQIIDMTSNMGVSLSYGYLMQCIKRYAAQQKSVKLDVEKKWVLVYDNLNIMKKVTHVRTDIQNQMMNLTTRLAVDARKTDETLSREPSGKRKDLTVADFLVTAEETAALRSEMVEYIKVIMLKYFATFAIIKKWTKSREHVLAGKSTIHSLELLDLDEKFSENNIGILLSFAGVLQGEVADQCFVGDQATCRALRGAKTLRSSEEERLEQLSWAKESPGDFHFTWECLKTVHLSHWGNARTPASLARLREVINRKASDRECKTFNHSDEFFQHVVEGAFVAAIQTKLNLGSPNDHYEWNPSEEKVNELASELVHDILYGCVSAETDHVRARGLSAKLTIYLARDIAVNICKKIYQSPW